VFPATGYFRVADQDGRWYFVTPQGAPFYASGIDTVTTHGDTDQTTGQCPYCEAVAADYPNAAAWETTTLARLRSWGFNTLGPFSDYGTLGARMPFEVELSMASGSDWFAPSFVANADQVAETQVAPLADSRNLIGYFTDSELNWGPPNTPHQETLLDEYLSLPAGSPGLAVAQRYRGDPDGFLTAVATRYFSVTTAAIRKYDTHHLILGVKAEGQEIQPQVLEAANHYIDVFSIEDYVYKPGLNAAIDRIWPYYLPIESNLADFERYFKKPLMIGEYAFISAGTQDPNTVPGIYDVSPTQAARASSFDNFVAPLYEDAPWLVGDDWFEYVDEPAGGRTGDGENNDFGMVNVEDQPYPTMEAAMRVMHSVTSAQVLQSGPACDSWTARGAGVICTATVPQAKSALQIVTGSLVAGKVDMAYGGFLGEGVYAAGGKPPYRYRVVGGSLPRGLKLSSSTGAVAGTPTRPGTSSFTVGVTDPASPTGTSRKVTITIVPLRLGVKTPSLGNARLGQSYAKALAATGGIAPFTWSVTAGSLPPGIGLTGSGELSGRPTAPGTNVFTVRVEDSSRPEMNATAHCRLVVVA